GAASRDRAWPGFGLPSAAVMGHLHLMDTAETITQFGKMLENLDRWLGAASAFAEKKKFAPEVLAQSRLAPDQFELIRQVQSACDAAKYAAAYLSGQKAPSHPDTEKTIGELRARLQTCVQYLESVKPSEYAGAAERRGSPPWLDGEGVQGAAYPMQLPGPHFHFHPAAASPVPP